MLQAFALQDYLESHGHESKIIDFLPPAVSRNNHRIKFSKDPKVLIRSAAAAVSWRGWRKRYRAFEEFKRTKMNLTRRYESLEELRTDPPKSDAYICGSDQIWNPELRFNPAYFLDFGMEETKRFSYAASLGVDKAPPDKLSELKTHLGRFDAVSVRESSGAAIVKSTGIEAKVVVDPSLLLERKRWETIASKHHGTGKYILTYCLEESEEFNTVLEAFSKHTGLPVVHIAGSAINRTKPVNHVIRDAGPAAFLGLLLNAEFIFTNSFHGTAFALKLGRPLIGIKHSTRNARMSTLLDSVGWPDSQVKAGCPSSEIEELARARASAIDEDAVASLVQPSKVFLNGILS